MSFRQCTNGRITAHVSFSLSTKCGSVTSSSENLPHQHLWNFLQAHRRITVILRSRSRSISGCVLSKPFGATLSSSL